MYLNLLISAVLQEVVHFLVPKNLFTTLNSNTFLCVHGGLINDECSKIDNHFEKFALVSDCILGEFQEYYIQIENCGGR